MKKKIAPLCICLSIVLSGCGSNYKKMDFNEDISTRVESILADYYEGMKVGDVDLCFSGYPDFYRKAIDDEIEYYGGEKDEYISADNSSWYVENYGEDYVITVEVTDMQAMKEKRVDYYNGLITDIYLDDAIITSGYLVTANKITKGSLDETTEPIEWVVFEIDGNYWIYDNYFEKMANITE